MDTQIAPAPTISERIRRLADNYRAAISRDATHHTKTSLDEMLAAGRAFTKALDEALAAVGPPSPPPPRPPLNAFIALPIAVRSGAAEAAARGMRGSIGDGSKAQHQVVAAAVWNFMRMYTAENPNA